MVSLLELPALNPAGRGGDQCLDEACAATLAVCEARDNGRIADTDAELLLRYIGTALVSGQLIQIANELIVGESPAKLRPANPAPAANQPEGEADWAAISNSPVFAGFGAEQTAQLVELSLKWANLQAADRRHARLFKLLASGIVVGAAAVALLVLSVA